MYGPGNDNNDKARTRESLTQCWESDYLDGKCLAEQVCAFVTLTGSPSTTSHSYP